MRFKEEIIGVNSGAGHRAKKAKESNNQTNIGAGSGVGGDECTMKYEIDFYV